MNNSIKKELDEFKQFHKNKYNVIFHILCGFLFMSFLFLIFGEYKNVALFSYLTLLLLTLGVNYLKLILIIGMILFIMINYILDINLNNLVLFLFFYFLPDLSHYFTKEKTVMNINNITLFSAFVNVFYLLPFSLLSC